MYVYVTDSSGNVSAKRTCDGDALKKHPHSVTFKENEISEIVCESFCVAHRGNKKLLDPDKISPIKHNSNYVTTTPDARFSFRSNAPKILSCEEVYALEFIPAMAKNEFVFSPSASKLVARYIAESFLTTDQSFADALATFKQNFVMMTRKERFVPLVGYAHTELRDHYIAEDVFPVEEFHEYDSLDIENDVLSSLIEDVIWPVSNKTKAAFHGLKINNIHLRATGCVSIRGDTVDVDIIKNAGDIQIVEVGHGNKVQHYILYYRDEAEKNLLRLLLGSHLDPLANFSYTDLLYAVEKINPKSGLRNMLRTWVCLV